MEQHPWHLKKEHALRVKHLNPSQQVHKLLRQPQALIANIDVPVVHRLRPRLAKFTEVTGHHESVITREAGLKRTDAQEHKSRAMHALAMLLSYTHYERNTQQRNACKHDEPIEGKQMRTVATDVNSQSSSARTHDEHSARWQSRYIVRANQRCDRYAVGWWRDRCESEWWVEELR
ncbi:hypothetical protein C8F01DRAFT_1271142 [Mycena amicta]|nr:hypothetical protein C8F01DRAFT_1271142 [Mycena amicta]